MRKALILGALPTPGTGPWVALDGERWECTLPPELQGHISIQIDSRAPVLLDGVTRFQGKQYQGDRARAIINEAFDADIVNITMEKVS